MKKPTKPKPPLTPKEFLEEKTRSWFGDDSVSNSPVFTDKSGGETVRFYDLLDLATLCYTLHSNYYEEDPAEVEFHCNYKKPIVLRNPNYENQLENYKTKLEQHFKDLETYELDGESYKIYCKTIEDAEQILREKLIAAGLTLKEIEATLKGRENNE